jgi:hypothetical protein
MNGQPSTVVILAVIFAGVAFFVGVESAVMKLLGE